MIGIQRAIRTARDHAPYLGESLDLYPAIADQIKRHSPDDLCESLFDQLPAKTADLDDEMRVLRRLKRQVHLVSALADIAEVWDWVQVTATLTRLADICMNRLLYAAIIAQGIEPVSRDNPLPGFFALALGKYGAGELNYSSDIDFNIFYDPEILNLPDPSRAERTLIRLVRALIRGFEAVTEDGYIFRTDLRLRPDPRSNSVAISTQTAERYYITLGQNWERAAMIKARVCGGDHDAGQSFIETVLSPFIWRKNLDYAAIEDILAMKRQIHARLGRDKITVNGHDVKVGHGGIREIEFYAQTQQLILGGREPELRIPRTAEALRMLAVKGFIPEENADLLVRHYSTLRNWEHRAQMMRDAQTHLIPDEPEDKKSFYALAGFATEGEFDEAAITVFHEVSAIFYNLFPDVSDLSSREGNLVFTGVEPGPQTLKTLEKLGYQRGTEIWHQMADWLGGRIAATRSERARELLTNLAPRIIENCADVGQADQTFFAFAEFFVQIKTGVSLLSMFAREPERLNFLIRMIAGSPHVSLTLTKKPQILDALADPDFLNLSADSLGASYAETVAAEPDFEAALNRARRLVREDHFRIATSILSGKTKLSEGGEILSTVAGQTLTALLPIAVKEVERSFGPLRGDVGVLGLGKLGGRELSLVSDLDIMLVYDPVEGESDAQRKYAKVTQRLINALSAYTEEGTIYEVDMALRPSGRSGPVAVSLSAFRSYYEEKAWTWEFMALSRARVITSNTPKFAKRLGGELSKVFCSVRPDLNMTLDVSDMLLRLRREKPPRHDFDIKNLPGGLRDIEFIAQAGCLERRESFVAQPGRSTRAMLQFALGHEFITAKDFKLIMSALEFYQNFRQASALTLGEISENIESRALGMIGDVMNIDGARLPQELCRHLNVVSRLTDRYLFSGQS